MLETIAAKLLEHGAWGILVLLLIVAVIKLWTELAKSRDILLAQALEWKTVLGENTQMLREANDKATAQATAMHALAEANRVSAKIIEDLKLEIVRGKRE
jgi:hypothetical protein